MEKMDLEWLVIQLEGYYLQNGITEFLTDRFVDKNILFRREWITLELLMHVAKNELLKMEVERI